MAFLRTNASWLYPSIDPYRTDRIKVSPVHELYFEESGNPKGKPVVYLHGGPGGGSSPSQRRFFNPEKYRIILFDQRGCGKSTPNASVEENTTWDLVKDIESIRVKLGIDRWMVAGGSWGSTLALAYAITHPEKVTELLLRGIFLCRRKELEWFYQGGANWLFPDEWERYANHIPQVERNDFMAAYNKRLMSTDENVRVAAAKVWARWEVALSQLMVSPSDIEDAEKEAFAVAFSRIESHYFVNSAFFKTDNYLIENVSKIRHIPGTIVQGRYDVVCPAASAWDLHRAWPEADLNIIPDAGHSAFDGPISRAIVAAADLYADRKA